MLNLVACQTELSQLYNWDKRKTLLSFRDLDVFSRSSHGLDCKTNELCLHSTCETSWCILGKLALLHHWENGEKCDTDAIFNVKYTLRLPSFVGGAGGVYCNFLVTLALFSRSPRDLNCQNEPCLFSILITVRCT